MDFQTDIVPMQGYKYDHHYFEAGNLEAINEQKAGDGRLNAWLVLEIVTENGYLVFTLCSSSSIPLVANKEYSASSITPRICSRSAVTSVSSMYTWLVGWKSGLPLPF